MEEKKKMSEDNNPFESRRGTPRGMVSRRMVLVIGLIVIVVLGVVIGQSSFMTIESGSKGVLMQWGSVAGILDSGFHFIVPFRDSVIIMNTQTQLAETLDQSCGTLDTQEVWVDIAVNYRLNELAVDKIYTNLRQNYEMRIIIPNIKESIRGTTSDFTAEELLQKRELVKSRFMEILLTRVAPYDIDIVDVAITNYRFNQDFLDITNAKVISLQEALKAQNDLLRIGFEAQQQIIQAEAQANATIATATATASANIIEAEANARAIQLVQEQLTKNPEYLQYLSIIQWDGKLPYFFGGDVIPFLQIDTNSTQGNLPD
jgi:regulator of protease activity HflC (stomatin/prohibitin superfamily)